MNNADVPIWEKYTLTIEEASKYFRIGENKLRKLAEENPTAGWVILNGNCIFSVYDIDTVEFVYSRIITSSTSSLIAVSSIVTSASMVSAFLSLPALNFLTLPISTTRRDLKTYAHPLKFPEIIRFRNIPLRRNRVILSSSYPAIRFSIVPAAFRT